MDIQYYQNILQHSQPQLSTTMSNSDSSGLYHQQQRRLQQQRQAGMEHFFNPFFYMTANHHQQQQQQSRGNVFYTSGRQQQNGFHRSQPTISRVPSTSFSSFDPPASWMPKTAPTFTSPGSFNKEKASPRELFFHTLSYSLKEAAKSFNNGKHGSNWTNPFLYKTTICKNHENRIFCRFGVNCWYAHGDHELRYIPESEELPDPEFIRRHLSFLGLPSILLEQLIQNAYNIATVTTSSPAISIPSPTTSSTTPSPTISSNDSPPAASANTAFFASSSPQSTTDLPFFAASASPPIQAITAPPAVSTLSPISLSSTDAITTITTAAARSPTQSINTTAVAETPNSTRRLSPKSEDNYYGGGWNDIECAINQAINFKNDHYNDGNDDPSENGYNIFGSNPW